MRRYERPNCVRIVARVPRSLDEAEHMFGAHELPLREWEDVAGSKLKPGDFVKAVFDLVRIYWANLRTP